MLLNALHDAARNLVRQNRLGLCPCPEPRPLPYRPLGTRTLPRPPWERRAPSRSLRSVMPSVLQVRPLPRLALRGLVEEP